MRAVCLLGNILLLASATTAFVLPQQFPLQPADQDGSAALQGESVKPRKLKGQFLHITDLHPDPFFKTGSSTTSDGACHRGSGKAGRFGAERSACDSPLSLINATFDWIADNIADEVDFVVWTGDSARHDNDERHPRTAAQITELNTLAAAKFVETFGKSTPIIPSLGNNDVLPHNVFFPGPNRWTRTFLDVWRPFVPEAQRHGFASGGGWFYVEAVPNHLAVFSVNSLYFFDSNSAVAGCAAESEPGYEQFEWLRVQLQALRRRGMKAIVVGHVPPARTASKQSWDESCWQKYTLWMDRFRDVVVASLWGHMNTDHFLLHDTDDLDLDAVRADNASAARAEMAGDRMSARSNTDYFTELRDQWAGLPALARPARDASPEQAAAALVKQAERYSLGLVGPSVVPNYFPSLRLVAYDVSGIDPASTRPNERTNQPARADEYDADGCDNDDDDDDSYDACPPSTCSEDGPTPPSTDGTDSPSALSKKHKKKKKKKKGKKGKHDFTMPKGPGKSAPPGPAYAPQPLSLLGYRQLYANLTRINADPDAPLEFELEYDTRAPGVNHLPDLTVPSYLKLARQIGKYKPPPHAHAGRLDEMTEDDETENERNERGEDEAESRGKKDKKDKKKKKRAKRNAPWLTFVRRAFVGARSDEDLHDTFGRDFVPEA